MKKTDRKRLDDALDKALAPPRKMPKQALDNLLDEYDDPAGQTKENPTTAPVPEYRSTGALKPELQLNQANIQSPSANITAVPEHRGTPVPEVEISRATNNRQVSSVIPKSNFYRKAN